jgi:hypothetical protein
MTILAISRAVVVERSGSSAAATRMSIAKSVLISRISHLESLGEASFQGPPLRQWLKSTALP